MTKTKHPTPNCECSDTGCPVCKGKCAKKARQALCRTDMAQGKFVYDIPMCDACASDAMDSGVFDSIPLIQALRRGDVAY